CFAYNAVMPQFEALTLSHLAGQAERYGTIRVWGSIGFIAVVGVLGVALDRLGAERLPLLMLPLFAALVAASFVNDYGGPQRTREAADASFGRHLARREVIVFLVSALAMQISFGAFYTFFAIYLTEHGYGAGAVGAFWTIGVGFEIAVFFFGAPLLTRWNARDVVAFALVCACVRWLVTALAPNSVVAIALAQMLHAITFAGFFAGSMQLLAEFFPGRMNGHGQGVFYGFSSGVGGVSGALLSGVVWKHWGGEAAFLVGAGIAAVGALVWIFARGPRAQAVSNG
ncbi:MAG TPA: MFS transporter, partial [Tahibacter sp.]|nr:MFS transporter [Tahibacter sp.]